MVSADPGSSVTLPIGVDGVVTCVHAADCVLVSMAWTAFTGKSVVATVQAVDAVSE
jgi:hypothetical protein